MEPIQKIAENLGLSPKAARVYIACLELGEGTVQELAGKAGVKRTTIYDLLPELEGSGALIEVKRNRKSYYTAETPERLLKRAKERIRETEESIDLLSEIQHSIFKKPRVYFLYGVSGFKHIWDMIFKEKSKEFMIITEGVNFLDFVKEKYILDEIIQKKKKLGIKSRQLISDSPYARKIVAKDREENRVSKILPSTHGKLPFTEVITDNFVAFISPRFENNLFIVENESFAATRKAMFEITWEKF